VTIQKAPKTTLQKLITSDIFWLLNYFTKKKNPKLYIRQGDVFGKFPKKNILPSLQEEETCYEIIMIFRGVGQIFSFLLLKLPYLANRF
jgi:hypothetical protein